MLQKIYTTVFFLTNSNKNNGLILPRPRRRIQYLPAYHILLFIWFGVSGCQGANIFSERGMEFLKQNKSLSALTYFNKALNRNPSNGLGLFGKGQIMLSNSHTVEIGYRMLTQASKELDEKANKQYFFQIKLLLIQYQIKNNHYDKAQTLIEQIPHSSQNTQLLFKLKFKLLMKRKQKYKALTLLKENCKTTSNLNFRDTCARLLLLKFDQIYLAKNLLLQEINLAKCKKLEKNCINLSLNQVEKNKSNKKLLYNVNKIKLQQSHFELLLELLNRSRDSKNIKILLSILNIKFPKEYTSDKLKKTFTKLSKNKFEIKNKSNYQIPLSFNYKIFYK